MQLNYSFPLYRIAPYHDLAGAVSSELNAEIQAIKAGIIDGSISVKN